jgi:hypothetical protein
LAVFEHAWGFTSALAGTPADLLWSVLGAVCNASPQTFNESVELTMLRKLSNTAGSKGACATRQSIWPIINVVFIFQQGVSISALG